MTPYLWILVLVGACASAPSPANRSGSRTAFHGVVASSLYVAMRDGVRIAIDVLLPDGLADDKLPALFQIRRFGRAGNGITDEDRFWVEHGFARILVDARGTGASFGTSRFGPEELPDLSDLVDWAVKQPWSNGRVGAIGTSFEGTAAELLAATGHPAVRAVAPWFSDYNYYTDLVRPGGMFDDWLLKNMSGFMQQMDAGHSARRVDGDADGALMKQAVAEHRGNPDIYSTTRQAEFSDDALAGVQRSLVEIGIPGVADRLRKARVPMLIFASWYDAGTVQGTLQRFRDYPGPQRVFIGAWSHGGEFAADLFLPSSSQRANKDHQRFEALTLFDTYLRDGSGPTDGGREIHYYTLAAAQWHSTSVWPPANLRSVRYFLAASRELSAQPGPGSLRARLQAATTGDSNRWHTQLGGHAVDYTAALPEMTALVSFTTPPLTEPLEITGQPVLHLRLGSSEPDPSIIAYLIVIRPDGKPSYLTEGHLRLLHRKLDASKHTLHSYARKDARPVPTDVPFDAELTLLPTSVRLPKASRLQLVLASGDRSTFGATAEYEAEIASASYLDLPMR